MNVKTIEIKEQGSPDVMVWVDKNLADPGSENVTVRHTYIGLNFIDTYHRSGLYPLNLPSGLGMEAAGIITRVGPNSHFKTGDRVAYGLGPPGSYSSERNISQDKLVKIPDSVSDKDIINFCKDTLAGFKCPKKVIFTELPKTSTGKILKYELRKMTNQ